MAEVIILRVEINAKKGKEHTQKTQWKVILLFNGF